MIVGSLLGDGCLTPTTAGYCFRANHGIKQKSYVDWKYQVLAQFVRTAPRVYRNAYYFRTITHPEFSEYRKHFYPNGRKVAPVDLLAEQLNELGLAVWVMDDGAADGRQLRLNTQSFTVHEAEGLAGVLRAKFGLDVRINRDKERPRLRFTAASHILPDMLYKLPP